jgi:phosphate:Na+ symporter
MELLLLLVNLAGSVMLLLWSVRMVRTGVERINGGALRRAVRRATHSRISAAGIGAAVAALLQSSTAVAVLVAGFAASGLIATSQGLALVLGADVGSAVVVFMLSLDLSWLTPVLLLAGGSCYLNGRRKVVKQAGRILLGIALVLLSLRLMSEATAPLRDSEFLRISAGFLQSDLITSFLLGLLITWLMHSSIAAILLFTAIVTAGILPLTVGLALMLGANAGAGLIPIGLTRSVEIAGRRVPIGNLLCRASGALLALLALHWFNDMTAANATQAGLYVVAGHVIFNILLVIVCLLLLSPIEKITGKLLPDPSDTLADEAAFRRTSALDRSVIHLPRLALASATREILRMSDIVEMMVRPIMDIYEHYDTQRTKRIAELEEEVNKALSAIKLYLADISSNDMTRNDLNHSHELVSFAINLEAVGDIVTKNMVKLAKRKNADKLTFSTQGWSELTDLHSQVLINMQLALNVLVSGDRESARQLVQEKDRLRMQERNTNVQHLRRLQAGAMASIETSDIHLETARALRQINSLFASIAYPILSQTGDLLDSRLADSNGD